MNQPCIFEKKVSKKVWAFIIIIFRLSLFKSYKNHVNSNAWLINFLIAQTVSKSTF